jgi:hypothetical protein
MVDAKQTPPVQSVAKKGMSTGAKVGIGIGIGCCVIILIVLVLGLIFGWNISNVFKRQQTYITELRAINDDTAKAYNELNDINNKYPNFTNADLETIDKDTVIMENAYDRLLKLDAPSDYKEIHEMYKKGLLDLKEAMPIYRQAVRTKNNSELQRAIDQINKGLEELKKAKAKVDEKNK